jgi:hypothetical protein
MAGDRLGARARSDGNVEVFRNGVRVGIISVSGWPYASAGGRIGMRLVNARNTRLDDFGGGNMAVELAPAAMNRVAPDPADDSAIGSVGDGGEVRPGFPSNPTALQEIQLSAVSPNPSTGDVNFSLTLPRAANVRWAVFDLQGRSVWSETRDFGAGSNRIIWPGRDSGGALVRSGIFVVVLETGGRRVARRFTMLR